MLNIQDKSVGLSAVSWWVERVAALIRRDKVAAVVDRRIMVVAVLGGQGIAVLDSSAVIWQGKVEQSSVRGLLATGMTWQGMGSSVLGCRGMSIFATDWQKMAAALSVLDMVA